MTARVEIVDVSHRYGSFSALEHINLTIEAGDFAVLLGPSGCGKTTLLSVLGGFLNPSSGSVLLDGKDVTQVAPAKRATTTMFQDYALFPHLNLLDNVGFGLRMRGQGKKQRRGKALELLQLVGLDASARKKPHELSGGQKQRVALARALAVEPDVLLLDEPLGALDLKLRRQMQGELKAIQKRVGTTFIHVTHDQEEAMAIADRIIVMNAGAVEDTGTPESIYLQPQSVFSANFMGEANLIEGQVRSVNANGIEVATVYGLINTCARSHKNKEITSGDSVYLCFRPEHVRLISPAIDSGDTATDTATDTTTDTTRDTARETSHVIDPGLARVIDHAFFGSYQRCQVKLKDGSEYTVHLPPSTKVAAGDELALGIDATSIVLLKGE